MNIADNQDIIEYIKGRKVEYHDDTHTYYVDGIKVPSVTQIVADVLPSPYKDVEPSVLQQAANRGLALHKEIELYEKQGLLGTSIEFNNYLSLKKRHSFKTIENEKLVIIEHENRIVCAGRLDMIIKMSGRFGMGIGDVKRTYNVHHDHLRLQLNLYRIGYMQSYGSSIDFLKCFHLRKFTSEMINVPIDEDYAKQALTKFLQSI